MWEDTWISLGISIVSVFAVTCLLTFDFISATIILVTICMILFDMMGMMYWWDISLNAVSLVNLVMVSSVYKVLGDNVMDLAIPPNYSLKQRSSIL